MGALKYSLVDDKPKISIVSIVDITDTRRSAKCLYLTNLGMVLRSDTAEI